MTDREAPIPGPTLFWVAGFFALLAPAVDAQQVLEIDFTAGRTIIDDEWRSMSSLMAADWDRNILYVADDEEPEGIMAFSLETGRWIRTIPTPTGGGPNEFPQGRDDIAIAPGGGLYISGYLRVIEYDPQGEPIDSWRPEEPGSEVCNFGGAPAVLPLTGAGLVRRGPPDASDERFGDHGLAMGRAADAGAVRPSLLNAKIACSADTAYVLMSRGYLMARQEGTNEGVDSILAYHRNGEVRRLAVPTESLGKCQQCPHWSQSADISLDDRGNIVLFGLSPVTHGAIIDPETGCYGLVRSTTNLRYLPVAARADSVLVFHTAFVGETDQQGRTVNNFIMDSATGASLHPLHRVRGEPCPGMLPPVP